MNGGDRARALGEQAGALTDRVDRARERVFANDWLFLLAVMAAIYLAYVVLAAFLGFGVNGVVSELGRVTFLAAVYAMLVLALNLHWGYAGLFNIGVAGFMAVGVYTMGMLTAPPTGTPPGLGLPLWAGIVGGMVAAAVVGFVAALPALRLKADYLAIVTLALSEIIRLSALSRTFASFTLFGTELGTGGGQGLSLPPNPVRALFYTNPANPAAGTTAFGEAAFGFAESFTVPGIAGQGVNPSVVVGLAYAAVLVVFVGGFYWLLVRIGNSPFGRVLKAIREDELVAESLGKNTRAFKVKTFMVGCALMGLGGILWMGSFGYVTPSLFLPIQTFYIFIALIIGGSGSNTGSVVGGAVFAAVLFQGPLFLNNVLQSAFASDVTLDLGPLSFTLERIGTAPPTVIDAVAPIAGLDFGALVAYSMGHIETLRLVLLGVVLIYVVQNHPDGLLGHRREVASTIDLSDSHGGSEDE